MLRVGARYPCLLAVLTGRINGPSTRPVARGHGVSLDARVHGAVNRCVQNDNCVHGLCSWATVHTIREHGHGSEPCARASKASP